MKQLTCRRNSNACATSTMRRRPKGGCGWTCSATVHELPWVDRVLFQRAVGNLIENSLAHTGSGGWVEVRGGMETAAARLLR